jgi:hypothetical protein
MHVDFKTTFLFDKQKHHPHAHSGDPGLPRHRDPSHGDHCLTHPPPEVSLKGQ